MTWIKIDDQFADHPKFVARSGDGIATWLKALAYSSRYLTDGIVPKAAQRLIGPDHAIDELVDAGLFIDLGDDWQIHDYTQHQRSRAEVQADRDAATERGRRYRERKRHGARDALDTHPESESEKESEQSSSGTYPQATGTAGDDERIEQVIDRIVDQRMAGNTRVRNPAAYKLKVKASLKNDGTIDQATQLATQYPTAPAAVIADAIEGDGRNLSLYRDAADGNA